MKTVFVCSPYRGDTEKNQRLARRVCRRAVEEGYAVICPHLLYPQFLSDDDENEREQGIRAGLCSLEKADELWVVGNQITSGMSREIARATELGISIRCVCDPLVAEEHLLNDILETED
mgnify:FL=1